MTMPAPVNNSSMINATEQTFLPDQSNNIEHVIEMVFLWLIIIVGLVGNSFIIAVVRIVQCMKTTTNYLLVNVAAADITTLLFTAMHLIIQTSMSSNGPPLSGAVQSFLCKFVYNNTITIVTLLVTALTLTVLAVERYHALVKPLRISRRLAMDRIAYVIGGIWVVAIVLVLPFLVTLDNQPNHDCSPGDAFDEMKIYVFCVVIALTLIPFLSIAFCYLQIISGLYFRNTICSSGHGQGGCTKEEMKEKRRLVTLLILLTAVFFLAFVPYGVVLILKFSRVDDMSVEDLEAIFRFQHGAQYLTLLSCSVNPFIYAFQSSNYRRGFKFIAKTAFCRDTTAEAIELRARTNPPNI